MHFLLTEADGKMRGLQRGIPLQKVTQLGIRSGWPRWGGGGGASSANETLTERELQSREPGNILKPPVTKCFLEELCIFFYL